MERVLTKIGIYGGSFDPIHHGHLILARDAREQLGLAKVVFVPTNSSPFKMGKTQTPAEVRLEMVRAAVDGEPGFEVSDCEVRRPAPSFTVDTAEEFAKSETDAELIYLIGEDHVDDLPTWHRFADLKRIVKFAVLCRGDAGAQHDYPNVCRKIDISGEDVRGRVAARKPIRYLVPPAVEVLIREHKLYTEVES